MTPPEQGRSILSHSSQAIKPASKLFATDPGEHVLQMPRNLSAAGPVSVVKFACDVFPGLGQKRQNR